MTASQYFSGYFSRTQAAAVASRDDSSVKTKPSATATAATTANSSTAYTSEPDTHYYSRASSTRAAASNFLSNRAPMINRLIHTMSGQSDASNSNADVAASGEVSASAGNEGTSKVPLQECREPTEATTPADATTAATATSPATSQPTPLQTSTSHPRALKILFLSSDTGGGHRASAQSLAQQFHLLFPGSTHHLCDIVQLDGPPPYNTLVSVYKHLSQHPQQWKLVYNVSNTRAYEMVADVHMKSLMERSVRKRILGYDPDVVVSVHPLMTNVPVLACRNISRETGRHLPIFTVCTDLGSAHSMWFANGVEKLFVASEMIRDLAMQRGKVPPEKIVMSGLPIRRDFSIQAEKMGNRHSIEGRVYRQYVRETLGLKPYGERRTVLVMGGGEGCGRLSHIVDSLYLQFVERGLDALILVVCGRNEKLRESLATRDWDEMKSRYLVARNKGADYTTCVGVLSDVGCIDGGVANHLRRIISSPSLMGSGVGALTSVPSVNAFSPTSAATYVDKQGYATSLPNSRPDSPELNSSGISEDESIEVVTESFVKRQQDSKEKKQQHLEVDGVEKTPETIPVSTTSSFTHDETQEYNTSEDGDDDTPLSNERVKVIGLGFVTKMAEYMVAADVLVTKAGPGTIAEAAALSLPVMLTSFLPGQEEGNVDYVVDGGFGSFVSDADPHGIADEVVSWLLDERKLKELSENAFKRGAPDAAAEIVEAIGESALRWKKINEESHREGGSSHVVDAKGEDNFGAKNGDVANVDGIEVSKEQEVASSKE
mmetsp:Transcript_22002/g.46070  ORF Transcript_22002/g.46070 Transcript_22002/m.46070 type:complete len:774 (+) Transcript_22002:484-2805(+)